MNKAKSHRELAEMREIPKDWEVANLGEIVKPVKGKKPEKLHSKQKQGFLPYLLAESLRAESFDKWVSPKNNTILVSEDDLVLIWDGSSGEVFSDAKGILASTMVKLEPKIENIDRKFLYYFLKTKFKILNSTSRGTAIPHVSKEVFNTLPTPLPPLLEQQKIASILLTVDDAIRKTDEIIQKSQELKKGLMQKLLTEGIGHKEFKETPIGKIPEDWEVVSLGEVVDLRKEVVLPRGESSTTYIGLEHINPGAVRIDRFGRADEVKSAKFRFHKNDILYGKLRPYLDKAVSTDTNGICSTDVMVIKARSTVLPSLLIWLMHTKNFINYATSTMRGTNHPRTSWLSISKFKFGLPALPEQQKIAEILSTVDDKLGFGRQRKEKLEKIKKGLMHELLTGKVRVN